MINKMHSLPFVYKFVLSFLLLLAVFFLSMVLGAAETSLKEVWLALTSKVKTDTIIMIREIRLPREIGAMFVGAGLSIAGAIMQGVTRNPLADPSLLGLTAGANAALALTIALVPAANYFVIMIACFLGAAVGTIMVVGIGAAKKGGFSPLRIVLAGAAVSAFLYAIADGIRIYFKISKEVSMWSAGGVIGTTWDQLQVIVPFIFGGIILSLVYSKQLTILSLNEDLAIGLGQKVTQVKLILFIIVIMLAGASVALVGNLAFIGLMIPHIVRALVGTDYRYILPMCATIGATFMLLADLLGRTINAPFETPVPAIVAMIGLPFFLIIVRKGGRVFS
ncbi:FecCD family ABC transporter permease [Calidifontibacillus erzurumensis]|uniref:Iron ABC transporter permease n=1 Tax=Calidifontibacillus erzurumensis TaxID=2741433 RepID=A0A8J8GDH7_9BACI|nr:iron ABC transporter permease [Calidifontibacillus erzurumensis]NSL50210.1 iron ABC transporter permease [Calidifontibacillus erzurumensis]